MSHQASDIITPKALLLDERLTPLERNAWLTFRSLASSDGTVVLSYDALRKYLPTAARGRIEQLRGNDDDYDPGGPSRSPPPDGRSPITNRPVEARGGIPKAAPASTATVRTVEKEVLKEVHTYRPQSEVQVSGSDLPIRFRQLPQDQQQILSANQQLQDLQVRQRISRELGHERTSITSIYLGR